MSRKEFTTSDLLKVALQHMTFWQDQNGTKYATITDCEGTSEIAGVPSDRLQHRLRTLYLNKLHTVIDNFSIATVLSNLAAWADDDYLEKRDYFQRVGQANGVIYYNLADPDRSLVAITGDAVEIVDNSDMSICFRPAEQQVEPDLNVGADKMLELLRPLLRTESDNMLLLIAVYIVSCFIYEINHPVLVVFGEAGSAKSTTLDTINKIVDPSAACRLSLGSDRRNLVSTLSSRYFTVFDNQQPLTQWQSDLFCNVSTGGSESVRVLYTTDTTRQQNLKGCLCLNGIDVVVTAGDLLDRSILFHTTRIPDSEYITEADYKVLCDNNLPSILGAAFNALSGAMALFENIDYAPRSRMADFSKWGYCIAEMLVENGGKIFEQAYAQNKAMARQEKRPPLILTCICRFMEDKASWAGTISELQRALEPIVRKSGYKISQFPASPSAFSRHLNAITSELQENSITFAQKKSSDRILTLNNQCFNGLFK